MRNSSRAAFAFWEGRIAPVFDVARRVLLVEKQVEATGGVFGEFPVLALPEEAMLKPQALMDARVDTLVCGAISRPLQESIERRGIRVLPFLMGEVEELVDAWRKDRLVREAFLMPGCRGGRKGRQAGTSAGPLGGRKGQGKGGGYQGGRGQGRGMTGAGQACVCPRCGYRARNTPGAPCVRLQCPHCGSLLMRAG